MTIMSAAEHRRSEEVSLVSEEVARHVSPETAAEERVMALEGTEDDPAVVEDPERVARTVADEVADDAESRAGCYTDSASLAEAVGLSFGDDAYEAVLAGLRGSPCIEVPEEGG